MFQRSPEAGNKKRGARPENQHDKISRRYFLGLGAGALATSFVSFIVAGRIAEALHVVLEESSLSIEKKLTFFRTELAEGGSLRTLLERSDLTKEQFTEVMTSLHDVSAFLQDAHSRQDHNSVTEPFLIRSTDEVPNLYRIELSSVEEGKKKICQASIISYKNNLFLSTAQHCVQGTIPEKKNIFHTVPWVTSVADVALMRLSKLPKGATESDVIHVDRTEKNCAGELGAVVGEKNAEFRVFYGITVPITASIARLLALEEDLRDGYLLLIPAWATESDPNDPDHKKAQGRSGSEHFLLDSASMIYRGGAPFDAVINGKFFGLDDSIGIVAHPATRTAIMDTMLAMQVSSHNPDEIPGLRLQSISTVVPVPHEVRPQKDDT